LTLVKLGLLIVKVWAVAVAPQLTSPKFRVVGVTPGGPPSTPLASIDASAAASTAASGVAVSAEASPVTPESTLESTGEDASPPFPVSAELLEQPVAVAKAAAAEKRSVPRTKLARVMGVSS
jgi:hypothetical protein